MKVCHFLMRLLSFYLFRIKCKLPPTVDYILFLVADVTVTPNLNEIRDYKYISKEELQSMFKDPSNQNFHEEIH